MKRLAAFVAAAVIAVGLQAQELNAYSGRYPFTNSGDIRSVRW